MAALSLALGTGSAGALAATSKKKPVSAKKHKPAKVHHHRSASLEDARGLLVQSTSALVQDQITGAALFEKNSNTVVPIASISKLMTAMVALDAKPSLSEVLTVSEEDVDSLKGTHSRLRVGTRLTREEMLNLALMSSENRAASALSRNYPGGREAFVAAMNRKCQALGLADTQFADPTGLTASNVSSARDLAKMVAAAYEYPLIRQFTTATEREVVIAGRPQLFHNTNSLVKSPSWEIGLSKTGYINEAGKCLVMQTWINNKPTIIVLLDSWGKMTRIGDANRIKRWVESAGLAQRPTAG
ncbi:MAG: D-alanyl-D-alanine endopeptidase [Rhodocyclaceae bacterium]|nr:D-alanyl-D-alanine endopeptidase [Rhodocyclaceae bacterium]